MPPLVNTLEDTLVWFSRVRFQVYGPGISTVRDGVWSELYISVFGPVYMYICIY